MLQYEERLDGLQEGVGLLDHGQVAGVGDARAADQICAAASGSSAKASPTITCRRIGWAFRIFNGFPILAHLSREERIGNARFCKPFGAQAAAVALERIFAVGQPHLGVAVRAGENFEELL